MTLALLCSREVLERTWPGLGHEHRGSRDARGEEICQRRIVDPPAVERVGATQTARRDRPGSAAAESGAKSTRRISHARHSTAIITTAAAALAAMWV